MNAVKEYIFSLMIISVSCGAVSMLAPEGTRLNNYVRFLISLIITVVLLSPLGSLMGALPELSAGDIKLDLTNNELEAISAEDKIITETCEMIKEEIRTKIENRLSYTPKDIEIECGHDANESVTIEKITVVYEKNSAFLFSDTEKIISELFMNECEVLCRYEGDK